MASATSQTPPTLNTEAEYNSPTVGMVDLNSYSSEDQARYLYAKYVADISSINCGKNALWTYSATIRKDM